MAKQLKVSIFLVGGIILFCVGLFLIGSSEQLFGSHFTVYTDFNDIQTLQTGAKVRVSGMDAGEVTGIAIPKQPSGQFRLKLKVDQKFHSIVRQDSMATIETEGMVGNKFVNIAKGTDNSPECAAGCTLPGKEPVSIGALMRQGSELAQTLESVYVGPGAVFAEQSSRCRRLCNRRAAITTVSCFQTTRACGSQLSHFAFPFECLTRRSHTLADHPPKGTGKTIWDGI